MTTLCHPVVATIMAGAPLALALSAGGSSAAMASAAPQSAAGIEHIAHACFRITSTGGHTILIDPYASRTWIGYDFPAAALAADAVLISHPHYDHDAGIYRGAQPPWDASMPVWRDPGTYEVGDVRVTGVEGKHADPYGKEFGQINTIWLIEVDGLRIVHAGDNGPIGERIAAQLGQVDVLMLPIDSAFHILSQAAIDDDLARLQPRLLIPMHYRHPDLEPRAGEPRGLGGIDDWLRLHASGMTVHRPHSHRIDTDQLQSMAGVLVLEHSPAIPPPGPTLAVENAAR